MRSVTDPAQMTPDKRLAELAAILARGILRLRTQPGINPKESAESGQKALDSRCQRSPHVSTAATPSGLTQRYPIESMPICPPFATQTWTVIFRPGY